MQPMTGTQPMTDTAQRRALDPTVAVVALSFVLLMRGASGFFLLLAAILFLEHPIPDASKLLRGLAGAAAGLAAWLDALAPTRDDNVDEATESDRPEPMATCCICYEETPRMIVCADNHATCEDCFEKYLVNKAVDLGQTSLLAAKAATAELAGDEERLAELGGGCFCPLHGQGGCRAARPFEDREIAGHVSAEAFGKYVQGKALLPTARKVQEVTGCPRSPTPPACRGPDASIPCLCAPAGDPKAAGADLAAPWGAAVRPLRLRPRHPRWVR